VPGQTRSSLRERLAHAANLRSPSQSVRNPTTWFQLGVIRDAGSEIRNGLGAFLYAVRSTPGFGRAFSLALFRVSPRVGIHGRHT
jgi:hypothetical protein